MKKWVIAVLSVVAILVILIAAVAVKTLTFASKQIAVSGKVTYPVDADQAAKRLSGSIQFKTTFDEDVSKVDYAPFAKLQEYLANSYPLVESRLEKKVINNYGLLYIWKGSDPTKKPILLLAHQDVVPAAAEGWKYDPFSGTIADGYIWGRGTLDDKCTLLGILEAVEFLLKDNYQPSRSVYLAFGFDEEVTGMNGAGKIAAYLKAQGTNFEFITDEGELIISGAVPGISAPVALIGTAEKGFLSLELSAESEGGHSSMPPRETGIGIISEAIVKLQKNPFPSHMSGPSGDMLEVLGPEMRFPYNMIFANMWLLGPVVEDQLASSPETDATIRTTTAPTMLMGSDRENVLPKRATAVINFRLMPGDSSESVIKRVKTVINDPRVSVKIYGGGATEASPVSSTKSASYQAFAKTIRQVFPDALVAPALVNSASDSSRYIGLSDNIYRFLPQRLTVKDLKMLHGDNERISISNYTEFITFYIQLVRNSN
jgi:carboxypeptidase PM20D1